MEYTSSQQPSGNLQQPDRRKFQRYSVNVQIEFQEQGKDVPLRTETTDLSRGGCYVQLLTPLAVGVYVNAKLWLADSPVRVRGRVVTRHPQFGNGIVFLEFQDDGAKALASYLDAIVE